MTEPVMCCGGTCVRAVCEYHKDEPLSEASPETQPSPEPVLPTFSAKFLKAYYADPAYVVPFPLPKAKS